MFSDNDRNGAAAFRRFRHLRADRMTRAAHAETTLRPEDFVQPFFVVEGMGVRKEIPSLKNVFHFSIDCLIEELSALTALGIGKILLFGVVSPEGKDETGSSACSENSLIARAVRRVKEKYPGLVVITDVCLCGYTSHGHCGLIEDGVVLNDETLPLLAQMALAHARAGADMVAPSAMMDGQVLAIRGALDDNGCNTQILAYSAKYASNLYGPFRNASGSAPSFGDRRSYQMDYRCGKQAVEEVRADIDEGASAVMVKPAHTYLDVIADCKRIFPETTLAAYHVSGEYMLVMKAAESGLVDMREALLEIHFAIKRAGADWIISYGAGDVLKWI